MNKKSGFSTRVGFVLAAAGSAVGLGNLWRFPYLAAKYGGGIFLLVYLILAVTFGFSMMLTEIAIGRKTGKSCFLLRFPQRKETICRLFTALNLKQAIPLLQTAASLKEQLKTQ